MQNRIVKRLGEEIGSDTDSRNGVDFVSRLLPRELLTLALFFYSKLLGVFSKTNIFIFLSLSKSVKVNTIESQSKAPKVPPKVSEQLRLKFVKKNR
jgi:hypothetical protein